MRAAARLRSAFELGDLQPRFLVRAAILCLALLALLSYIGTAGPVDVHLVLLFVALGVLAESLQFERHDGVTVTCVDVFYLLAFVTLTPSSVAWFALVVAAYGAIIAARSVPRSITMFPWVAPYLLAWGFATLVGGAVTGAGVNGVASLAVALLAGLLALRAGEAAYSVFMDVALGAVDGSLRQRWASAMATVRGIFLNREIVVQTVGQGANAFLGALAFMVWPPAVAVLIVPFLVAWRSQHNALKLADAEHRMGIDSLTGLANRGRFFELAERELATASRYGHPLAVIMGDLDNFKRVNDLRGHLAGDEVLRLTAAAVSDAVEGTASSAARYGGEEFVLLVPAASRVEVLELAEQVRLHVQRACSDYATSISLGVAYLGAGDKVEDIVGRADKALYSAKFDGKNCVHEWGVGADMAGRAAA